MLEYHKLILEKVSFDKYLFWKEYRKSLRNLPETDAHALKVWLVSRFTFRGITARRLMQASMHGKNPGFRVKPLTI